MSEPSSSARCVECPTCGAPVGQQCPGGANHWQRVKSVERTSPLQEAAVAGIALAEAWERFCAAVRALEAHNRRQREATR